MSRPKVTTVQLRLLDDVELAIRSIRYPVDESAMFQNQVQHALSTAGMYVTREVGMSGLRRVDLVVVDVRGNCALELDRDIPRQATLGKFADMPAEVLRVLVLRRRVKTPVVPSCDRVITVRSSLRMVPWLHDGRAILEEGPDVVRHAANDTEDRSFSWRHGLLARKPARKAG